MKAYNIKPKMLHIEPQPLLDGTDLVSVIFDGGEISLPRGCTAEFYEIHHSAILEIRKNGSPVLRVTIPLEAKQ